ncbi:MAG: O-methyltransferase [Bacilli bacterium]|nr:O-methyltransferase [Bacilli bacterium]MBR3049731.1 O-methyltransferase [Bacilli bacterium]
MVEKYSMVKKIREDALNNKVPIIMDDGINFITNYIIKKQVKNILEIGTAVGYSAIMMCLCSPNVKVTTIERDEKRYLEALNNIKKLNLEDRITLIYNDAANVKLEDNYDLIFIDAAKAQNMKFFKMFEKNLNDGGAIITDNLNFHGLVFKDEEDIKNRNVRALVRKIKEYKEFLKKNKNFYTEFYDLGDGISVSIKG